MGALTALALALALAAGGCAQRTVAEAPVRYVRLQPNGSFATVVATATAGRLGDVACMLRAQVTRDGVANVGVRALHEWWQPNAKWPPRFECSAVDAAGSVVASATVTTSFASHPTEWVVQLTTPRATAIEAHLHFDDGSGAVRDVTARLPLSEVPVVAGTTWPWDQRSRGFTF